MLRKILLVLLGLIALAAAAFFAFAPGILERQMNPVTTPEGGWPVSAQAQALHDRLIIGDWHSDALLWDRNLLKRADRGHTDIPRLQDGNVAVQVFTTVTKSPSGLNYGHNSADAPDNITKLVMGQLRPIRTWSSLKERALDQAARLHAMADRDPQDLRLILTRNDLQTLLDARASGAKTVGAILGTEGGHPLEGQIANLQTLYDAGFRLMGLTHFFDNDQAGSMQGEKKGGLTPKGREAIARMESLGMVVDIAHSSHQAVAEILAAATRPVVSSHGGVQATCKVNRNLSDDQIRAVAATGGLIGIGYWDAAVCDTSPASIAKAMKHVRDLVGIQHVALGSDYDGATTVRFDTSKLVQVTQALIDAGFTDDEIRAAMGGNAIRVLREGLVPLTPPAP